MTCNDESVRKILGRDYDILLRLRRIAKIKELLLDRIVQGEYDEHTSYSNFPHFVVLRNWNSWYPSFFNTIGGCYAVILPPSCGGCDVAKDRGRANVVVIDPGFKFMESLRRFRININDISAVVVTHFHPDHTAGLAEFLTLIHKLQHKCKFYLNKTTFDFLKDVRTGPAEFFELKEGSRQRLARFSQLLEDEKRPSKYITDFYVEPVSTFHREMGDSMHSLGLKLVFDSCEFEIKKNDSGEETELKKGDTTIRVGILGDTDGAVQYFPEYLSDFADVDAFVLHLGTISAKAATEKYGSGDKHLYDAGLVQLLFEIERRIKHREGFANLRAILISEFGLEMANIYLLLEIMNLFRPPNEWQAFLSLLEKTTGKLADTSNDDESLLSELELEIFAKLCVRYLMKTEILEFGGSKENKEYVDDSFSIVTGIFAGLTDPKLAASYYQLKIADLKGWLTRNWQDATHAELLSKRSNIVKDMSDVLVQENDLFVKAVAMLSKAFLNNLLKYSEFAPKEILMRNLRLFLFHLLAINFQALSEDDIARGVDLVRIISNAVERRRKDISKEEILRLTDDPLQIYFNSSLFCALLCADVENTSLVSEPSETSGNAISKTATIFEDFQGILKNILKSANLLIADFGLDLMLELGHDEANTLRYSIKGKAFNGGTIEEYETIDKIHSHELTNYEDVKKQFGTTRYRKE